MIRTRTHANAVQQRRHKAGKAGIAKAVHRYARRNEDWDFVETLPVRAVPEIREGD